MIIPFTKPVFMYESLNNILNYNDNNISYIKKCEKKVNELYNFEDVIFTTSCTHALEMMAMILNIGIDDEVLIPSYTFVSTANAFVKFGAKIKCIDSNEKNPNINISQIEKNITNKTKALVVVHYGGLSCEMDRIKEICDKHNIYLLEDAAQAINTYYKNKFVGSFGLMSAFSFHSTKNINCGEGGMLVINDKDLVDKAHIICDKGTNRFNFINGKIDKYEWIDKGSSYSLSEINAAFLYPQLKNINEIIEKRRFLWYVYKKKLTFIENNNLGILSTEKENCKNNYHIFYILFENKSILKNMEIYLSKYNIQATTHYNPLHLSKYYKNTFNDNEVLVNAEKYGTNLLRLPLYNELSFKDCEYICDLIIKKYNFEIKIKKHSDISNDEINKIMMLKSEFWKYSFDSQKEWMNNNIKKNDIHIMIFKNNVLIGYGLIMKRNCNIIDSIIICEKVREQGYGSILNTFIIDKINNNGFLLCEKYNIDFYKKFGWEINNEIIIKGKNIDENLYKMTYKNNFTIVNYS